MCVHIQLQGIVDASHQSRSSEMTSHQSRSSETTVTAEPSPDKITLLAVPQSQHQQHQQEKDVHFTFTPSDTDTKQLSQSAKAVSDPDIPRYNITLLPDPYSHGWQSSGFFSGFPLVV